MKTIHIFILLLLLSGCASISFHPKIEPATTAKYWKFGKAILVDSIHHIRFQIHWEKSTPEYNFFWVSAKNEGPNAYQIDPMDFSIRVTNFKIKYEYQKIHPFSASAVDPESMKQWYDNQILEIKKRIKSSLTGDGVLIGLDLLVGILDIATGDNGRETEAQRDRDRERDRQYYASQQNERDNWRQDIKNLEWQKEEMFRQMLKMHSLEPGETVHGMVVFPRTDHAEELVLEYENLNENRMQFFWRQEIKKVEY